MKSFAIINFSYFLSDQYIFFFFVCYISWGIILLIMYFLEYTVSLFLFPEKWEQIYILDPPVKFFLTYANYLL